MVFGSFLSNTDMQSGSPSFGTPESAIGLLCTGQIARHFGLPFRSGGGLTSSQTADAQSAYEALMTLLPTFLAGTNFVMHSAGWLEGGLVSCYEKFIVDVEILRMLKHEFTPLEIDEASRSPSTPIRRSAPAVTSSALPTRSSASATASTARCSPPRRTSTAGPAMAASTPPRARRRSGATRWTATSRRRWTTRCARSCRSTSPAGERSSETERMEANGLIAERAYAELRDRIVTLRLPPGTLLREDELMLELAIGRTPLREAVKRLALENLVAVQPRSGTFVTSVDAADIIHISEVRADLEAQAAELAARRMEPALRERAEALLDEVRELERSADAEALMRLDETIHRLVWEGSRNPYLVETLERYFVLSLRVWYVVLDRVPGLGAAVVDQARLLEAVLGRDPTLARSLMREHVLAFEREIMSAFSRE